LAALVCPQIVGRDSEDIRRLGLYGHIHQSFDLKLLDLRLIFRGYFVSIPVMEQATEMLKSLLDVWKEMFSAIMKVLPKAFSFTFWVLSAIVILPCVYISNILYPLWTKWGENL
jgi:hypothetical protein